jgi:predicted metal-dependent hydrolase
VRYSITPYPPYAFVPGEHPHPTRDPKGHSYSEDPEPPVDRVDPDDWHESEDYLFGADLYNDGYLWEAHEAWEGLWHVSKRSPTQALFIQGLIQVAAGCLKIRMGQPRGMVKLFDAGVTKLHTVMREVGDHYMGVSITEFTSDLYTFAATEPTSNEDRPRLELSDDL